MNSLKSVTMRAALFLTLYLPATSPAAYPVEIIRENIPFNNFFGAGARAMGMGGAYLAAGDDLSSLYWNPAGLGLVRRIELAGSFSIESLNNRTSFFNESRSTPDRLTRFNSGGVVLPVPVYRGSLVFALGVNRVHSFDGKYLHSGLDTAPAPEETVRYKEEREVRRGGLYQCTGGLSVEVEKGLFVGAGFNFWTGNYDYIWSMEIQDSQDISEVDYSIDRWDGDGDFRGYNFTLGTVYRKKLARIGFTLTTPTTFRINGEDLEQTRIVYDDGTVEPYEEIYGFSDEKYPLTVAAGIALTLPSLILEADFRYFAWDTFELDESFILGEEPRYKSTNQVHLGGELLIPKLPLRIRGGYYIDPIAFRGVDVVRDRRFITFGAGMLLKPAMAIDIAVVRGNWELSQPYYSASSRTTRMFGSLSYRF